MNVQELLKELESLGAEQNRKIYRRHGVTEEQYGLSFANLRQVQKRIKQDHRLAMELWATGNHDCRILATLIADPAQADDRLLDSWANDLSNYIIADAFSGFVGQTTMAREKAEKWSQSEDEWTGRTGWHLMAHLAMKHLGLPDGYFEDRLEIIEGEIHSGKNRVKDAMNNALIAIGIRNDHLEELALAAAQRIGEVEVDHGKTGCKTPDAGPYIRRAVERKKSRKKAPAS